MPVLHLTTRIPFLRVAIGHVKDTHFVLVA